MAALVSLAALCCGRSARKRRRSPLVASKRTAADVALCCASLPAIALLQHQHSAVARLAAHDRTRRGSVLCLGRLILLNSFLTPRASLSAAPSAALPGGWRPVCSPALEHTARHSAAAHRPAVPRGCNSAVLQLAEPLAVAQHFSLTQLSGSVALYMLSAYCVCRSRVVKDDGLCDWPTQKWPSYLNLTFGLRRDVWQHSIAAGAHAYMLALWGWLAGNGWVLPTQQPADSKPVQPTVSAPTTRKASVPGKRDVPRHIPAECTDNWCVR